MFSALDMFIHYSFMKGSLKGETFFVIEVFRLTVFFMICHYYISKASGLLPNKKMIMIILNIFYGIILTVFMAIGLVQLI